MFIGDRSDREAILFCNSNWTLLQDKGFLLRVNPVEKDHHAPDTVKGRDHFMDTVCLDPRNFRLILNKVFLQASTLFWWTDIHERKRFYRRIKTINLCIQSNISFRFVGGFWLHNTKWRSCFTVAKKTNQSNSLNGLFTLFRVEGLIRSWMWIGAVVARAPGDILHLLVLCDLRSGRDLCLATFGPLQKAVPEGPVLDYRTDYLVQYGRCENHLEISRCCGHGKIHKGLFE